MVSVFLQNQRLNEVFDITFTYRHTNQYRNGFTRWIKEFKARIKPWYLLSGWLNQFKLLKPLALMVSVAEILSFWISLKREKPDVLHIINGGYPGAFSCNSMAIAGKLARVPKITYFITSTTRNPWWYKPITFMVKRSVDKFISASQNLWAESGFLGNKEGFTSWNILSNTIRDIEIEPITEVREKLGIPQAEVIFLCMGDLEKRKGFDRAIDALPKMEEIGTPRSLLIVGDGVEDERIKKEIKRQKNGVYRVLNETDIHPYSIINACDVLLVPSRGDEDWPNVILIAMKYKKPCLVSEVCGLPEMIKDLMTGYVFSSDELLRIYMENLLNKDLRTIMGNKAKERYEQLYREEKIIEHYIEMWN